MFLETPSFPGCPRYGYQSDPMYSTTIIQRASGVERRNQNWAYPLTRLTVTVGPSEGGDPAIQELLRFYHAVRGPLIGFRVKDYADFKSCDVGDTPTRTDQPLVQNTDSPTEYLMFKRYSYGALNQDRLIYKPVSGTILIADNGVLKTETTDYTIDYSTGRVTPNFTPTGSLTWGGEFDLPMRFEGSFPIEIISHRVQVVSFALQEIRLSAA
jgi:uncharacterized protein (TIGR02217 family)